MDRELGPKKRDMSVADFRRACRDYATRFIDVMSVEFQRLGVFGDWDHLYLTMDFRYQAAIARALGKFVEQGSSTRARSRCTGASIAGRRWPKPRSSTRTTRPRRSTSSSRSRDASADELRSRVPALAGRQVSVLIWTTTPWTIPSNLAIAFHPGVRLRRVRRGRPGGHHRRGARGERRRGDRAARSSAPVARMKGAELEHIRFQHPLYARDSVGVLADYVTLDAGTGAVHTAPGHGSDDFITGMKYGLEIYAPVGPADTSSTRSSCSAASACSTRTRRSRKR